MEFLYHTEVVWNHPLPNIDRQLINEKIASMVSQEKTDGVFGVNGNERIRQWVDLAAAEEWRDFVNSVPEPAVSVAIKSNS